MLGSWEIKNADIRCMRWARDISHHLALAPSHLTSKVGGRRNDIARSSKTSEDLSHFQAQLRCWHYIRAGAAQLSSASSEEELQWEKGLRYNTVISVVTARPRHNSLIRDWKLQRCRENNGPDLSLQITPGPCYTGERGEGADCTGRQLPGGQEKIKIKITRKTRKICQIR